MTSESGLLERDDAVISDAMKIRFFPFGMASQDGSTLKSVDGDELVDFSASWAVANTGYRHPAVRERIESQLREAIANSPLSIPHEPVVRLAERLQDHLPMDFPTKVWFGLGVGGRRLDIEGYTGERRRRHRHYVRGVVPRHHRWSGVDIWP
ncbi:hypothetical protein BRC82_07210 [Halobacteriales archaeon QS_1_67_19]|nr:MAG: hypothetical protein BRC82_07210 [Halobacteriales archaeon QS_1_67_19]